MDATMFSARTTSRGVGAVAGALALLLLATACGDDGDSAAVDLDAGESPDTGSAGDASCLLDASSVSDAIGHEVTVEGLTMGGTGAGSVSANFDTSGAEIEPGDDPGFSVGWVGCTFTADNGTEYMVGELVDENGDPDLTGFNQLVSWAEIGPDEPERPAVGDESFFDGEELVVRDADRTLVIGFGFGSEPDADADAASLAAIAAALIESDAGDLLGECEAAVAAAPESWGDLDSPLLGGGGGSIDGVEYTYDTCSATLSGAGTLEIKVSDADLFELRTSHADLAAQEVPEIVPDVGERAVRMSGRLYVQVGDRAVTAHAMAGDKTGDPAEIESLGTAAAAAVG